MMEQVFFFIEDFSIEESNLFLKIFPVVYVLGWWGTFYLKEVGGEGVD